MIALLRSIPLSACVSAMIVFGAVVAGTPARAIDITWSTVVSNTGNANDVTGFGSVDIEYRIMKFEWTNAQYAQFLNAIDPEGSDPNDVYNGSMGTQIFGGISFDSGAANGSKYATRANMADKPVNYVSWWDAARVANWLQSGAQNYPTSDSSASAPQNNGVYTLGTATGGTVPARNSGATYWIPTENEWYKAAYFNPTLNSGSGGYRFYGNGFQNTILPVTASLTGVGSSGSTGNFANFNFNGTNPANWNGSTGGNVTTVGTNGASNYYEAFDMSGNVWELNDFTGTVLSGTLAIRRGLRGGSMLNTIRDDVSNIGLRHVLADQENSNTGFRLVTVPEPSAMLTGAGALVALAAWRSRKPR